MTSSGQAPPQAAAMPPEVAQTAARLKDAMLQQPLTVSGNALALLVLLAVRLGWYLAGLALRPVHEITTARRLCWGNLHERIGLTGLLEAAHRPRRGGPPGATLAEEKPP
ncbi:hypothetical protein [Streptomyces sp. SLBN-118]|uniref:hypothetical protein n=1 Tax=Streptomyces sp. SLBN-118 TaxID=2768454 RepID=UPI001153F1CA|nr:hypothetical protein [Streptomyces sp. SLBN-118]